MRIFCKLLFLFVVSTSYSSNTLAEMTCSATPEHSTGTHYIPNVARMSNAIGKGLVIHGHVRSAVDCKPIADAVIEFWQAGDKGTYEMHLRAFTLSMPDGSYRIETEWPNMPIPHIHFIVSAENHAKLVTQWIPGKRTEEATFDLILKPALSF